MSIFDLHITIGTISPLHISGGAIGPLLPIITSMSPTPGAGRSASANISISKGSLGTRIYVSKPSIFNT